MHLVYLVVVGVAMYLSLRRNNGFHFGSFLASFVFSPVYILYALAVPVKGQFDVLKGQ